MLQIGGVTEGFILFSCPQANWQEADVFLVYSEVRPDTVSETSLQVPGAELTRKSNAEIKALSAIIYLILALFFVVDFFGFFF